MRKARLIRYEHGGGRFAVIDDRREHQQRELVADFYNEDTRELIFKLIQDAIGAPETQPVASNLHVDTLLLEEIGDCILRLTPEAEERFVGLGVGSLRALQRMVQSKLDASRARRSAVETTDVTRMRNTLVQSGYTDCGGELWKPPLGRRPVFLDENLRLLDLVARMLPYVQQSDPADFADIEAATAIGREAMEALATIRPEEPPRCIHRAVVCEKCAAMAVRNFEKSAEPSPDQLVGALQDRVHKEIGVTRPGRAVKAAEPIPTQEWIDKSQGLTGLEYDANGERLPEKAPCERCEGSGRLTIYDTATYVGQACSPIGDEPCPECQPENGYGER